MEPAEPTAALGDTSGLFARACKLSCSSAEREVGLAREFPVQKKRINVSEAVADEVSFGDFCRS